MVKGQSANKNIAKSLRAAQGPKRRAIKIKDLENLIVFIQRSPSERQRTKIILKLAVLFKKDTSG